jgi:GntR family transcriptional repressor for pyruvate dehydrogenase complex
VSETENPEQGALVLETIGRGPSLFELVSDQLLNAIRAADLSPGSKIPSERELGDQFGVSRTVIREAVRHLAAKGVLEVQTGSGVRVANLDHKGISESIELYLRQSGPLDSAKIHEVRETLELKTVQLAAVRASDEQLAGILETCERMEAVLDDAEEASLADTAFHRAIAEATDNPLYLVLVDSLADVLLEIRRATLGKNHRGAAALAEHRLIAEALSRRDPEKSVEAMRDHLEKSLTVMTQTTGH